MGNTDEAFTASPATSQTMRASAETENGHNELLMCDMSAPDFASDCSNMGPNKLRQLAQPYFAIAPTEPVNFIVVYAASASVELWQARQVADNIDITQLPVTPVMQQLANDAQQIHQHYPMMQQYYSFTQQEDGSFVNELGDKMELNSAKSSIKVQTFDHSFGDCQTALDFMHRPSCALTIEHWLNGIAAGHDAPLFINEQLAGIHQDLQQVIQSADFNHSFAFILRYKDHSSLAITIAPPEQRSEPPIIKLLTDASRTSDGVSFSKYEQKLLSGTISNGIFVSEQELKSILEGAGCPAASDSIALDSRYFVTNLASNKVAYINAVPVQEANSIPVRAPGLTCDKPGLPAFWPFD